MRVDEVKRRDCWESNGLRRAALVRYRLSMMGFSRTSQPLNADDAAHEPSSVGVVERFEIGRLWL